MYQFPVTISHKNDVYAVVIDALENLSEIQEAMKLDGYNIGKSSIRSLISGTVKEASGFVVVTEEEEAPLPDVIESVAEQDSSLVETSTQQEVVVEEESTQESEPEIAQEPVVVEQPAPSRKTRRQPKFIPTWEAYQEHIEHFRWISFADYMVECFR